MDKFELIQQYDRFITQVREEAKDLYWLFNFFFVIDSAVLGIVFIGRVIPLYEHIAQVAGLLLSLYWILIIRKQRLWRNYWVKRIQTLESELNYPSDFHMWPVNEKEERKFSHYLLGRRGVWRLLFLLPLGFTIVWALILIGK